MNLEKWSTLFVSLVLQIVRGSFLTAKVLGEKYLVWKVRVKALLEEIEALKVIDCEIPKEITEVGKRSERNAKSI